MDQIDLVFLETSGELKRRSEIVFWMSITVFGRPVIFRCETFLSEEVANEGRVFETKRYRLDPMTLHRFGDGKSGEFNPAHAGPGKNMTDSDFLFGHEELSGS